MNVTSRGNCNICKRISVRKLLVVATNCYRPMLYVNCLNCKCNSHSTQICLWYNHSFLISQSRYSICQSIEFAWQINACTWWKLRAISGHGLFLTLYVYLFDIICIYLNALLTRRILSCLCLAVRIAGAQLEVNYENDIFHTDVFD